MVGRSKMPGGYGGSGITRPEREVLEGHERQGTIDAVQHTADVHDPGIQIHIAPAQPERLTPTKSDRDGDGRRA